MRETLWNEGVVPVAGYVAAEADLDPPAAAPFLVIRDPDGHEIELVEPYDGG
jgi:hypothetical protein